MVTILLKKKPRENSHLQKMPESSQEYGYGREYLEIGKSFHRLQ